MSDADLQWVVNAYTLTFGGFLLLGGRAGDLIGRKRVFLAGVVLFTVASMLCGIASSQELLIIGRGIQGLGAALVSPAALSIVTTTFEEGPRRTKAMGVWAAIAVGGGAVGLVLGGALTQYFSWPWIFFVNVPVGIVAFVLSLRLVPESRDEHAQGASTSRARSRSPSALILLVYAIVRIGEKGWGSARCSASSRHPSVLLAIFVFVEQRSKRSARAAEHLPRPLAPRRQHRHVARRLGALRDVLLQHALRPARARLLTAQGGARLHPVHRWDHRRLGALAGDDPEARRARCAGDRPRHVGARDARFPATRCRRLVLDRSPPGDPPLLGRAWGSCSSR